jgi:hypothetical protein
MTTREEIETRLLEAVEVNPSEDGLRWLDQRVAEVAARPAVTLRDRLFVPRTLLRPLPLVAAFILLTGAVVGGMGLLERLASSTPGWRTAFDRAEVLGIQQTDAGLTLTLERAYADLNQVMVFVTIEGLAVPRSTDGIVTDHLAVFDADLRDPTGRGAYTITGVDDAEARDAEATLGVAVRSFQFEPPASVAGMYELTINSIGYGADGPECVSPCVHDPIAGAWRFEFALPEPAGIVLAPGASDTVGQATLSLTEFRVTPTMVSARIAMHVDGSPVAYWAFIPSEDDVRHDGTSYGLWSGRHILPEGFAEGPETEFSTTEGTDEAAGTWEIVIPELDYGMTNDEMLHLVGPWTLTVTVP